MTERKETVPWWRAIFEGIFKLRATTMGARHGESSRCLGAE
jgi:hypothetical protein